MPNRYLPDSLWKFEQTQTYMDNVWRETDILKFANDNIMSPIVYNRQPDRVDALKIHYPYAKKLEKTKPLTGRVEVAGLEKQISNDSQMLELSAHHWQYKIESPEYVRAINKQFDIPEQTYQMAMDDYKDWTNQMYFGQMTTECFDPANNRPHKDRIIACGRENGLIDAGDANINAVCTRMQGVGIHYDQGNAGNSGLNTECMFNAMSLARTGPANTYKNNYIIREAALKVSTGVSYTYNRYFMFDPDAYTKWLLNDTKIQPQLVTARQEEGAPSLIKGGEFKGTVGGYPIFVAEELKNYRIVTGGHTFCWGFLMGASGFGFTRGQAKISRVQDPRPPFDDSLYIQEYQGYGPLWVDSLINDGNKRLNRGVIHIFSQLN